MKITYTKEILYLGDVKTGWVFRFSGQNRKEAYPSVYMMGSTRDFIDLQNGAMHSANSEYEAARRDDKVEILNAELYIR